MSSVSLNAQHGEVFSGNAATSIPCFPYLDDSAATGINGSAATGINGNQNDNSATNSGAVYVFVRFGELWQLQAYIKANNTGEDDGFGIAVSLSADGNT